MVSLFAFLLRKPVRHWGNNLALDCRVLLSPRTWHGLFMSLSLQSSSLTWKVHLINQSKVLWIKSHHSLPSALPTRTSTLLLVKLSSLRHQTHTEQLVHHSSSGTLGCDLLQNVSQYVCQIRQISHYTSVRWRLNEDTTAVAPVTIRVFKFFIEHLQLLFLLLSPKNNPSTFSMV